jgi:signal transduction histidine kinase
LSPDQQEQLINLQESCLTLKNIVDDLLDLKILEHGKVRFRNAPCDCLDVINSLVAKCEPIVTGELTHITHVNSQCSSHLRMGDRTRFEQVIVNLVNNAIKFTQEGEVEIETFINDAGVTVIVSDTGIGMKSDQLERIFEDFTQADEKISTRYGGSGLGLSIVRSIMDQLGGSIVVTSEFGKGSRFTVMFSLPAATEEDLQGHSN